MQLKKILYKNSEQIKKDVVNINGFLEKILHEFDFHQEWNFDDYYDIEIKKSFVRGILRYNYLTDILLKNLLDEFIQIDYLKNYNLFSRLYPMIHLPKDIAEAENRFHYDQGDKIEMHTCWLPITANKYNPINVFNFENNFTNILKKFLVRFKYTKYFSSEVRTNQGDYFIWSGRRLHKGNLNISKEISCAFQMKLSSEPILTEPNVDLSILSKKNIEKNLNYYKENFELYKKIIIEINNISHNSEKNNVLFLGKISKIISKHLKDKNQEISFALSVFSQRLRSLKKNGYEKINIYSCYGYDIASLLIGSENLISLKRIKLDNKKFNQPLLNDEEFKKVDFLNSCPTNTKQWNLLFNNKID